jgi:hypothetical protein
MKSQNPFWSWWKAFGYQPLDFDLQTIAAVRCEAELKEIMIQFKLLKKDHKALKRCNIYTTLHLPFVKFY